MSSIGHVRTALQYYDMAHLPMAYALGHALSARPLNRAEIENAEADLRRAADALKAALEGEANVIRGPFQPHFKRAGEVAMRSVEDVGRVFDAGALKDALPINGGEKPQTDGDVA